MVTYNDTAIMACRAVDQWIKIFLGETDLEQTGSKELLK